MPVEFQTFQKIVNVTLEVPIFPSRWIFLNQFLILKNRFEMSLWTLIPLFFRDTLDIYYLSPVYSGTPCIYQLSIYFFSTERVTTRYLVCTTVLISGHYLIMEAKVYVLEPRAVDVIVKV